VEVDALPALRFLAELDGLFFLELGGILPIYGKYIYIYIYMENIWNTYLVGGLEHEFLIFTNSWDDDPI